MTTPQPPIRIEARSDGTTVLFLYDEILPGAAAAVVRDIASARRLAIRINSPGGSVADGIAIHNALLRHPAPVTVHIDGLAASIASLIAMAGEPVRMAENALMMIHAPWTSAAGNADELRELAEVLDRHRDAMISAYTRKSGKTPQEIEALMAAETWLTADDALAAGFIDAIDAPLELAASMDLSRYPHAPRRPIMSDPTPNATPTAADPSAASPSGGTPAAVVSIDVAALRRRNDEIRAAYSPFLGRAGMSDLMADMLANPDISAEQARQKLLAKLGEGAEPLGGDPHLPATAGHNGHHGEFRAAVVDGLLARHGVPIKTPHPAARDVRGMSAADIAATLLGQQGRVTRGMSRAELVKAALSTSDLPALLENVATKAVMTGFEESEAASHRRWTRAGDLPDFKEARRVALSEAPGLELVPERGEYQHGSLSDAKETIQLATYGRILSLSRQMIVNDDLGELARVPYALGQAGARKEADLVYTILTGNPAMRDGVALFHADHGNLVASGSGAAPSVSTLGAARAMMRVQRGLGGEGALNIPPKFLIVPAALETTAEQLLASLTPTTTGEAVPGWIRALEVVTDARLDDDSATGWYLASDPVMHDTIEVARLDGQGADVIQREGFEVDDLQFKVRLDVGAAVLDWRGLVHNAGA